MTIDLLGGSIVSFHLKKQGLNPLVWNDKGLADKPRERGHFLCLDRWGQPSAAELKNGMPFHGEATHIQWKVVRASATEAEIEGLLPMAGFHVTREFRMADQAAVVRVRETVTNRNPLGRPYNMVQHPTIGPPFLDESVVVDSNARRGFLQESPLTDPENPTVVWPQALRDGIPVDMRRLKDDPRPNVVSYVIEEERGWVTAANAAKGLLIGYSWDTREYPWLNLWRHVADGKPLARGLEFGTTGLHQPFGVLARVGTIFGKRLSAYLDSGESQGRSYVVFLAEVPSGFQGAAEVNASPSSVTVRPRGGASNEWIRVQ